MTEPHDYQSNSHKSKQRAGAAPEEKKVEKVVVGEVVQKRPSLGHRFRTVIFGGDFREAARYVAADVLLPAVRNIIVDAATRGASRVVYGDTRPPMRRPGSVSPWDYRSRVQYNTPVMRPGRLPDQAPIRSVGPSSNDLILASREEAELVLERLGDCIDSYDQASVADLYDLTGQVSSHTDNNWGWTNLRGAEVRQVREGWLLVLPKVEEF